MNQAPTLATLHAWAATTLCLAARLGALLLVAPPFGGRTLPPTVRVALVVAVAALLAGAVPPAARVQVADTGSLFAALLGECAVGALLAVGVAFAFAAWDIGARALDVQIGFGIGQVFDPGTQRSLPIVSALFAQAAVIVFFATDSHHLLLRGFAAALERFPVGRGFPLDDASLAGAAAMLVRQSAAAFTLGFALVAPVVLALALIDLGLGVLARNLPQMNLFVVGIPVKVVTGIAALAIWLPLAGGAIGRIHGALFGAWDAFFAR